MDRKRLKVGGTEPVPLKKSIIAAFEKQRKQKKCGVCGELVLMGVFRSHQEACTLRESDSDIEVLEVLSPEEAKCRRAGSPIVLHDDVDRKDEIDVGPTPPPQMEPNVTTPPGAFVEASLAVGKRRKRSSPIKLETAHTERDENNPSQLICRKEIVIADVSSAVPDFPLGGFEMLKDPSESVNDDQDTQEKSTEAFNDGVSYAKYVVPMIQKIVDSGYGKAFWGEEAWSQISSFLKLRSRAPDVFLKLFLRNRQWFSLSHLISRYPSYAPTMKPCVNELLSLDFLTDGQDVMSLNELFAICDLSTVKKIAKTYHINTSQPKQILIDELNKACRNQKDVFGRQGMVEKGLIRSISKSLGKCIRVSESADTLVKALLTLASPKDSDSSLAYDNLQGSIEQAFMFKVHKVETGQLLMAAPLDCAIVQNMYRDYADLRMYVEAKSMEVRMVKLASDRKYEEVVEVCRSARDILSNERFSEAAKLPPSLRRLTTPTVLVRCFAFAATCLEKLKKYHEAIDYYRLLLKRAELSSFCADLRGEWWIRMTLNLEFHLKRGSEAGDELLASLKDHHLSHKHIVVLEERLMKLTKDTLSRSVVQKIGLPIERRIQGEILKKELGDGRVNRFILTSDDGEVRPVSVENLAKEYYITNMDFSLGVHAEGGIWHTALGILLYNELFCPDILNSWLSRYQVAPTDLNTKDFYEARRDRIDARLKWLSSASSAEVLEEATITWNRFYGAETGKIVWDLFQDATELQTFVQCCGGDALAKVFLRIVSDHRNNRSGFPDLALWNPAKKTVMAVEVKGPGDRLSSKQRLWLYHLVEAGIPAEVCYVEAA